MSSGGGAWISVVSRGGRRNKREYSGAGAGRRGVGGRNDRQQGGGRGGRFGGRRGGRGCTHQHHNHSNHNPNNNSRRNSAGRNNNQRQQQNQSRNNRKNTDNKKNSSVNKIDDTDIGILEPLIEKVSNHDPECTEVEVPKGWSHTITEEELIRLVVGLKRNPCVRKIDFLYAQGTAGLFRQLAALFCVNTVIQRVQLPMEMGDEELLLITESLRENTTVTTLNLGWCFNQDRRGGEIIRELLLSNATITEINLSRNYDLGSEGVACIAQVLRNNRCALKKLNLDDCGLGDDGARELSTALGGNNNVLVDLHIGSNEITFTGLQYVLGLVGRNSVLQVLNLAWNHLDPDTTGASGDLVSRALKRNTTLQELDFAYCGLSAADLSLIFQTLARDNRTLSRLRISGNEMNEASTNDFARFLPEIKGLKEIEFYGCGVSLMGLHQLLEGLWNNKSLVCIQNDYEYSLRGDRSRVRWRTWCTFVARRNKMSPLLEGNGEISSGGHRSAQPVVPQSLWPHLLKWCDNSRHDNRFVEATEARASLIHQTLRARANEVFADALGPRVVGSYLAQKNKSWSLVVQGYYKI